MSEVIPIFSTPLLINHLEISDDLKQYVREIDYEPVHIGNGDWSVDKNILNGERFKDIKECVLDSVRQLSKGVYLVHDDIEFVVSTSWILRHRYGHHTVMHNHTGSLFSGVLYIDIEEGGGDIVFHNERAMGSSHAYHHVSLPFRHVEYNSFNTPHYTVPPRTGMLLTFSSGLSHSVRPNINDVERYSLSFNVLPRQMLNIKEIIV